MLMKNNSLLDERELQGLNQWKARSRMNGQQKFQAETYVAHVGYHNETDGSDELEIVRKRHKKGGKLDIV